MRFLIMTISVLSLSFFKGNAQEDLVKKFDTSLQYRKPLQLFRAAQPIDTIATVSVSDSDSLRQTEQRVKSESQANVFILNNFKASNLPKATDSLGNILIGKVLYIDWEKKMIIYSYKGNIMLSHTYEGKPANWLLWNDPLENIKVDVEWFRIDIFGKPELILSFTQQDNKLGKIQKSMQIWDLDEGLCMAHIWQSSAQKGTRCEREIRLFKEEEKILLESVYCNDARIQSPELTNVAAGNYKLKDGKFVWVSAIDN